MTQITTQNGAVVLQGQAVGTGQGCCCGSGEQTACCLPDGTCEGGLTQAACEECGYSCYESYTPDTPGGPCDEGYTLNEAGDCERTRTVTICAQCGGTCTQIGPCGTFYPVACQDSPCAPGCTTYTFAGPTGCVTQACADDWRAALEAAGYVWVSVEWGPDPANDCGQVFNTVIRATCCGCRNGDTGCDDCTTDTVQLRCEGPCYSPGTEPADPADCPDGTIEVNIPRCCPNPFP